MDADKVRIFVCSDFHAFDASIMESGLVPPSWFDIQNFGNSAKCPVTQLKDIIRDDENLRADIAICAGDFGDKAHPTATKIAWQAFHDIAGLLNARHIIATAGNHDLDSRFHYNDHDAKGFLQALTPKFPLSCIDQFDQYWSRHFAVTSDAVFRVITLNSSAYHGYQDEYAHGRISTNTLYALKETIKREERSKLINILVCHHPPHQQTERGQGDGDGMKLGDDLINFLDEESADQWLVIHGHKHFPTLQYARGNADPPILLSCGSLSAIPYPNYGKDGKNQIHFIEFDLENIRQNGLLGLVHTFEWTNSTGWISSRGDGGLSASSGFGNRESITANARAVAEVVQGKVTWREVLQRKPMLKYLTSNSLNKVLDDVKSNHGIKIGYTQFGIPDELIRPQ